MVDYYYIEPEPEVIPETEIEEPEVVIEAPPSPPPSPKKLEVKPPTQNSCWLRLTTPTRPPRKGKMMLFFLSFYYLTFLPPYLLPCIIPSLLLSLITFSPSFTPLSLPFLISISSRGVAGLNM